MPSQFPLTPTELLLRQDLGTHGDTGNELHAKVDRIKSDTEAILTDTSDIQPKIGGTVTGTLTGDIAAVQAVVDSLDTDTTDILAILENATYGLSALHTDIAAVQTVVDATSTKIGSPAVSLTVDVAAVKTVVDTIADDTSAIIATLGEPENGSVVADIADIASKVAQIQNNTRTTVAILDQLELPASGSTNYYLMQLNNFDTVGNMEEPDAAPTVAVTSFGGADRTGNLVGDGPGYTASSTMIKDSDGRYHLRYKVVSSHAIEGLMFSFTIVEGGVTRIVDRVSGTVLEISSTFTATDRSNLNAILADTADMQPKIGSPAVSLAADHAAIKGVVDAIEVDTTAIEADTQDIQSTLVAIQNKDGNATYSQSTDSLEGIRDYLGANLTTAKNPRYLKASKASGSLVQGASEVVVLGSAQGVTSPYNLLKEIRVVPSTQTSSNFTVEIFEESTATVSLMKYLKAVASKGDLRLALDLVYINQNTVPDTNIYVKITNVADTSSSVFNVEVRGHVLQNS